ncbi:rifin PIR protein, putative [Plasmodium reichenowi]|uniref:Rifin PIR protein, putative n=1 Tax=Plasmodium reichenowi TaxID=5854 RepID=A0A2P9DHH4_PLARE|nr:rifin PIR protein, putative [Plasmodium reichenowi]
MKVHYINILLFALPLNILVYNQRNHYATPSHTQTNRSLCECELYAPANYDNDPQMKEVIENFNKQTQQRFHEYDDRMKTTRQKCKEQCNKEIQKIILKDKLEKQMAEQLTALETKVGTNDIPICVSEKSLSDKTENFCLNCGMNVGGGVTLSSAVLGGIGGLAVNAWKDAAIVAAIELAKEVGAAKGAEAGLKEGMRVVIGGLKEHFFIDKLGINTLDSYFTEKYYMNVEKLATVIYNKYLGFCAMPATGSSANEAACEQIGIGLGTSSNIVPRPPPNSTPIVKRLEGFAVKVEQAAEAASDAARKSAINAIKARETALIEGGFNSSVTSIYASIIAIEVIVLIMVIIYLVLRYRRKKKMKKKLQYIKLLEE